MTYVAACEKSFVAAERIELLQLGQLELDWGRRPEVTWAQRALF